MSDFILKPFQIEHYRKSRYNKERVRDLGRRKMKNTTILLTENWRFKEKGTNEWLPAKVPGCVHTDLLANKKIPHPFYGKNELNLQWIDKKDWEYETVFDLPEELFQQKNIEITFEGLDTYADVYVNDHHILSAYNMFRIWKADITSIVKQEGNRLYIHFRSPIHEDLPKLEALGYGLPAGNDHSEDGGLGDKKVSVFARKAPYHYGWDWGPRFVTSGIWKDVRVEGWTHARITDLYIHQTSVMKDKAELTAFIEVEADHEWQGTLSLQYEDTTLTKDVFLQKGTETIEWKFTIENPKLWWTRELGDQHFYHFTVSLHDQEETIAEKTVRTGLRSIRLVREEDEVGKTFYFELNGVPVFAKGANHIPNDSFVTEVTYERYRHEIETAARSNMNMLRVWGGGIYEYEDFYNLCDEYGILVWQDFMFACSMYPGDKEFVDNVRQEAIDQVKRLRNHPCLALWCGNNEMDSAWAHYIERMGWGWKQQYSHEIREKIWRDYETIFHEILPEVVETYDPGADYWPSSPMSDLTGDERQHSTYTSTSGDMHYWDVWHGEKPLEDYKKVIGRFMSEYGFQSFPELKTVKTYAEEEDMALESEVMLHHQKNPRGNQLIKTYMDQYYKEPKDFPSFLYMSHILQADAIRLAIEAHRAKKPYCMGTLYWQMNDCWPVASWSSMDYYGRWKALQYVVKRSYRDVAVIIDEREADLHIYLVSDLLKEVSGTLSIQLLDFAGKVIKEKTEPVHIGANTAEVVKTLQKDDWLQNVELNKVVLYVTFTENGHEIDAKEHYFVKIKEVDLEEPTIEVEVKGNEIILKTNKLAKNVWIDTDTEGIFSDNYFDLLPGKEKRVTFYARSNRNNAFVETTPENIQVRSMMDFIKQ